ncbi:ubiquitin carboxyl-terminal hydrolase 36 isoform X1 [Aedes aegypti]|uniref:Ubiquitin carboxyl-terminal hydrolase 36 n=1 Tax=Aedes aegypti TaxID=7159 RepID=A0A6I8U377_AEDAE|nr:ubiquitin carboxyl-terminal hydrolase 36 isoform X1 [Aedes aegypti]
MPGQMVCDSTSLVSAALRDSLTSSGGNNGLGGGSSMSAASSSSYFGVSSSGNNPGLADPADDELVDRLESQISDALRRNQLKPIRYEEVSNYSSEQDSLKSKYIVLKATASLTNGNINGSGSIGGGGAGTNTQLMNGGGRGNSSFSGTSKLSNGISHQNGNSSSSSAAGKDQLPAPKRVLYPRENVQLGWKATGHKWNTGAGFTNVGNTCYLNSTLQALFHVPAIANWLLSDKAHRERCEDNVNGQGCIICAMAKTLMASQNSSQGSIKPYLVVSKLQLVCKHLVPGRQEDAHEFLRYLVEAMEKSYLARFKNSKELDQYSKETTPLNQILGGYLRSEVKCLSCHHVSTTFQHFEDLLLDIRKVNSIEEALTMYFARERLEEMQYKCEACKKKVAATKQFSLERAPFALCIQLKRFSMMGNKINKHVELKTRLDLTPFSSKSAVSNGRLTYKLVSMVTHLGSTQHCGHYTAIGGTESGTYYVFDDSLVRPISLQNVTSTNAYIIFYELESVQNGIKQSASSTATSASCTQNAFGSPSGKYGSSSFEGGSNSSSGATAHASTLRGYGSSSNSGHNPLIPSKLENRSNFIGPMLPQQTQEKTKKLANGLSRYDDDEGEALVTSTSSRVSPISSTTSSLSCPSPVKQSCPNGPSSSASKLVRNSPVSSNAKSKFGTSFNGIANAGNGSSNNNNGSFKSSSSPAASSSSSHLHSLPSMPKLCNSLSASKNFHGGDSGEPSALSSTVKGAGFSGLSKANGSSLTNGGHHNHNGGKSISIVPYEADDDDEDEDEDEVENDENQKRSGGGSKKRNGGRNKADEDDDDDSDEDVDRIQSHVLLGPGNNGNRQQRCSNQIEEDYSPKSPPVIKTKAGLWKVSDNRPQSSSSSSSSSANNSNNTSPATSGNSSPANYGHMNGNGSGPLASGYHQSNNRQFNGFNGYNGNGNNNRNGNGNDVVNQLYQFSHRGYGAPVRSWNGQQTNMDRELSNERREDRKRQYEDDCDTEMDRGRTKKVKTHFYHQQQRQQQQHNPFQMHQMNGGNGGGNNNNFNRKWNNNNGNQFGGKYYQNRGGNYYQNGNHPRNYNGFRNGRHGRNGFYNKSHHNHQRDKF